MWRAHVTFPSWAARRAFIVEMGTKRGPARSIESDPGAQIMTEIPSQAAEPPIITVGELMTELRRWPDTAAVAFRCPLQQQEFRFYRLRSPSNDVVQFELNQYPETPLVAPT